MLTVDPRLELLAQLLASGVISATETTVVLKCHLAADEPER
jgi:hypothetical protein